MVPGGYTLDVTPIPTAVNYYAARVNVRQTSAITAGNMVWALFNPASATQSAYVEDINLAASFEATTIGGVTYRYDLLRFGGADPTGGSSVSVVKMDNTNPDSLVVARFFSAGLTEGSLVKETAFAVFGVPGTQGAIRNYRNNQVPIVLAPNEGLGFALNNTTASGMVLSGGVKWSIR